MIGLQMGSWLRYEIGRYFKRKKSLLKSYNFCLYEMMCTQISLPSKDLPDIHTENCREKMMQLVLVKTRIAC